MTSDNRNRIILILVVIVVILGLILIYKYANDYNQKNINLAYQAGIRDASMQFQQSIISQLNTLGFFTITLPAENNKTVTVKLAPMQQAPVQPSTPTK